MINLIVDILLPPTSLAVLAFVLILGSGRARRLAAVVALAVLIALGLPVVSMSMLNALSPPDLPRDVPSDARQDGPAPGAVVILSADAVRLQGVADLDPGPLTLDRLRAGVALARRTDLPVLVSGGPVSEARTTLAGMMEASLRDDFRLPARWAEDRSRDTWENAQFSAAILAASGIRRIYLVTHDWHMRRALIAFRHFGMDPVPVPVRPSFAPDVSWRSFVIGPTAWFNSYVALHEWVGLAYYTWRG